MAIPYMVPIAGNVVAHFTDPIIYVDDAEAIEERVKWILPVRTVLKAAQASNVHSLTQFSFLMKCRIL